MRRERKGVESEIRGSSERGEFWESEGYLREEKFRGEIEGLGERGEVEER